MSLINPIRHVTSDIAAEYNDIGGGVNPLGYKGHRFTPHSYGYAFSPKPIHYPHSPAAYKLAPRRANFPVYDFSDESDEQVLSMKLPPPLVPIPLSTPDKQGAQEAEHNLCCPVMGPITPFLGMCSLNNVGTSSVLSHDLYMAWRLIALTLAIITLIVTVLHEIRFLAYIQGAALLMSVFVHILLLRRAMTFRRNRDDKFALSEKRYIFGWDAFVLQAAVHLCLMVPFIYGAFHVLIPGFVLAGVRYVGNLSSYMLLALTVFHVVEIAITPIPFRITHILPIVAYCLILCLVAMWRSGNTFSSIVAIVVFVAGCVTGLSLTMFNRGIYLLYHQHHIDATDEAHVAGEQSSQDKV